MYRIRPLEHDELAQALQVIHEGFATTAEEFGLTRENCPTNGAFIPLERLQRDWEKGAIAAGSFDGDCMTGYAQVRMADDGLAELEKLCVIPQARHGGTGAALVLWAEETARRMGAQRMLIGVIEKNVRLTRWYAGLGFVHIGTRDFPFLPFRVGYMRKEL